MGGPIPQAMFQRQSVTHTCPLYTHSEVANEQSVAGSSHYPL